MSGAIGVDNPAAPPQVDEYITEAEASALDRTFKDFQCEVRSNSVRDVPPTFWDDANAGDLFQVVLADQTVEIWSFGSPHVLEKTIEPGGGGGSGFRYNQIVIGAITVTNEDFSTNNNSYGVAASGGSYDITIEAGNIVGAEFMLDVTDSSDVGVVFQGGESYEGDPNPRANDQGTLIFKKTTATNWAAARINQSGAGGGVGGDFPQIIVEANRDIDQGAHYIVTGNTAPVTLTVQAGIVDFMVSRSFTSTADVIIDHETPGTTIGGNPTATINRPVGPHYFFEDPADPTNIDVVLPNTILVPV